MYNTILAPLLNDDPKKSINTFGIEVRKLLYPSLFRLIVSLSVKRRIVIDSKYKLPKDEPLIFVSTHEFAEDAQAAYLAAGRFAFIVNGSVSIMMRSILGLANWMIGMILVDRTSKSSRAAVKDKMVYALSKGASVILYPEGTWNKSPNQVISGLFPGVYDVAKKSKSKVVAIAHQREGNYVFSKVGDAFDISEMEESEAMELVKEKMATLKYELMETYGKCSRSELPHNNDLEMFWKKHNELLMSEVKLYDYELEKHTKYRPKGVTDPSEVFEFLDHLNPSKENAFLY